MASEKEAFEVTLHVTDQIKQLKLMLNMMIVGRTHLRCLY